MRHSTLWTLFLTSGVLTSPVVAQLSPAGFTGAINSPTADVLNAGEVSGALTNNNPEKPRFYPGVGSFGSVNLGFGVLPGLEIAGRLSYDGDLQCNMYVKNPPCQSWTRDLSASGKYQLPFRLDGDTRFALGAVDVGGAATNYRSYYGVATSSFGPVDLSLGYGRGSHKYSTLDGVFGSTQVYLTPHWRALLENDTHVWRGGVRYVRPLNESLVLELSASRKLSNTTALQTWQAGIGLTYSFGQKELNAGTRRPSAAKETLSSLSPSQPLAPLRSVATPPVNPSSAATVPDTTRPQQLATLANGLAPHAASVNAAVTLSENPESRAQQMANRLRKAGFASVWVGFDDARGWVIQAEPLTWRKNRLDALGMALALWQKEARPDERVHLALSHLQNPVLTVRTNATCLARFTDGGWWCDGKPAMTLDNGASAREPALGWSVTAPASAEALRPQIEIGPLLRQRVGTEVGLYDASVGLDLAWELALGRGWLWQGEYTVPVANTTNFERGMVFGNYRIQNQLESSHLAYQQRLGPRTWAQASVGYLQHNDYGGQLEMAWLSPSGNLRLSGLGAYYRGSDTSGSSLQGITHPMALASARWSVIDGRWFVEAQAGQFYNQDRGFKLASHHWYGDHRLSLLYRNTASDSAYALPRTQFAGFQITIPLGGRTSKEIGPATVRGSDQWVWGLESKVRSDDNIITAGYGVAPIVRHGLVNDTLDFDRAGLGDMQANIYRVRAVLREMAHQP